ncbi:MAG: glycosyltransferase family 39 protein [Labilithrix sp.]|nr:glycosyltransferase family 39 protein [Labilithrix sp.]MCW5813716.1 glycosyltransferase family 39 protein [Labilithrix sp.]
MARKTRKPAQRVEPATLPAAPVPGSSAPLRLLVALTAALFAARIYAAGKVGFGDSEALYASYAVHPQPAYLDHPGLIGQVARLVGGGSAPAPESAHYVTAVVATLVPWLVVAVARVAGTSLSPALVAGAVVAVVPEIAVGLFGLTPDLLLAPLWLGAIGLAIAGLTHGRPIALLGAGLLAGVAASAKVSGLLLFAALAFVHLRAPRERRTIWPWAGFVAGGIVLLPIALWEARSGFPMLRHRFVETQSGAGIALRNVGQLVGGQLVYLSPAACYLAFVVARDLVRRRDEDAVTRVLFATFAIPFVPLLLLCVWSPIAEPHWIAPALLALPIHAARRAVVTASQVKLTLGVAGAFTLLAHAWVLVPASARLRPTDVDAKADIASELYGWPAAAEAIKEQRMLAATPADPNGEDVVLVGPHWTVCAQLQAAFPRAKVGCATPVPDDFDRWYPRERWKAAAEVLFVTDNRFDGDGAAELPLLSRFSQSKVRIFRGGRPARVFELYLYARRGQAAL